MLISIGQNSLLRYRYWLVLSLLGRPNYALQLDLPSNLLAQCALGALKCRMVIEGRLTPHDIASKRTTTPCHENPKPPGTLT